MSETNNIYSEFDRMLGRGAKQSQLEQKGHESARASKHPKLLARGIEGNVERPHEVARTSLSPSENSATSSRVPNTMQEP